MNINQLKPGDRVESLNTGNIGTVKYVGELVPFVKWDAGGESSPDPNAIKSAPRKLNPGDLPDSWWMQVFQDDDGKVWGGGAFRNPEAAFRCNRHAVGAVRLVADTLRDGSLNVVWREDSA